MRWSQSESLQDDEGFIVIPTGREDRGEHQNGRGGALSLAQLLETFQNQWQSLQTMAHMLPDPAEILRIFFEITKEVIDRDIQRATADFIGLIDELSSVEKIVQAVRTPESEAHYRHLLMVQAAVAFKNEHVPPELKTFYAAKGAGSVVQDVEEAAASKDTLGQLKSQMDAIQRREGLQPGEFWAFRGDGPDDYRALEDERDQIFERIENTVHPMVLRRYGLTELADLYERDFATFDLQREIGSRIIYPRQEEDTEVQKLIDLAIVRKHGQDALERIRRRVKEIRSAMKP